uniref:Uncharacterized protein n=1 Tax=Acrobeloides nanus TaxID=290746 RepID=A0A914DAS8_9BILA
IVMEHQHLENSVMVPIGSRFTGARIVQFMCDFLVIIHQQSYLKQGEDVVENGQIVLLYAVELLG